MSKRPVFAVVLIAGAVTLAACSSGSSKSSSTSSTTSSSTSSSTSSTTKPAAAPASTKVVALKVGTTKVGKVVSDAQGKTVYIYKNDRGTTSAVPTALLAAWPPVAAPTTGTATVGTGLEGPKLTAVKQSNGQTWLAYNGHLLYTFSGDPAAGDANGQALGKVWYVLSPAGQPIGE